MTMRWIALIVFLSAIMAACSIEEPSSTDLVNASDDEKREACRWLRTFNWDYWSLGGIPGRSLEVAAAIHTDHPGPAATKEYCGSYGPVWTIDGYK